MNEKELFHEIKDELEIMGSIEKGKTVKISELSDTLQKAIKEMKLPQPVTCAEVEGVMTYLKQFNI